MKVLIVGNTKYINPLIKYLDGQGDLVSILRDDNKELDSKIKDFDVIYITEPNKFAIKVKKAALKFNVPIVSEYVKQNNDKDSKNIYKSFYKYVNAIHYLNKEDQEELEFLVGRRTNGHIFDGHMDDINYLEKLRNMFLTYSDEINHNSNKKLYYSDEVNDDFAVNKIKVRKQKRPFKYIHKNPIWNFFAFLVYNIIARPLVFLLNQAFFHQRIKNKAILKRFKKKGYFIYSNHTNGMADAFTPNILSPKRNYIVVSRETVSIKGLKGIVTMLGAIPVYTSIEEVEPFNECIRERIKQNKSVTIYPEAHIWPYYTKIRHFKKDSFRYPVELNVPVYVLTNTWQKRRLGKKPKLISYLSGPLFPDESMSRSEAMEDLKERTYFEMIKVTRSVKQVKKIQYIKVDK